MVKIINVDQALHGYANGHQLLAASYEFHIDDRNRMDELSDLNGHCGSQEFVAYLTGYPIENGQRYVFAKTWYAYEMKRPGCVWTHSIIVDAQDVGYISDIAGLMKLFTRPTETFSYSDYKNRITIQAGGEKRLPNYDEKKLQYVIYTVFSSGNPEYVIVDGEEGQFDNELFIVLNCMPSDILKNFTFCTMSYDIRKYGVKEFQYQMSSEKNIYRFHKKPSTPMILIKKFPYWVTRYTQELKKNQLNNLLHFIIQYGDEYLNLTYYNQFCRLYFAVLDREGVSLKEYFEYIDAIMPLKLDVFQITVEHILDEVFFLGNFQNQEYQILERMDMGKFKLKKEYKELLSTKIIEKSPEKLYPFLQKYISGRLKPNTQAQVEDIIKKLEPRHLRTVSYMNENICVVLVRMNHELLLCKELWRQPRDFQRAILYAGSKNLQTKLKQTVLTDIIRYGTENIENDIYEFYGDDILPIIYDLIETPPYIEEVKFWNWIPILLQNPVILFEHINVIPFHQYRLELFLRADLSKIDLNVISKESWEKIYVDLIKVECNEDIRMKCFIQFMFAIFGSIHHFEDAIVEAVVKPIYQRAKDNKLDFDTWNCFQNLLPEVKDCFAWDRCLRIRNGLEQKGYRISLMEM